MLDVWRGGDVYSAWLDGDLKILPKGGALDDPKVLSSRVFEVADVPTLGRHSRRASEEDDSEHDQQFLVPTTVIDALTEKMNGETSRHTCVLSRVFRPPHDA